MSSTDTDKLIREQIAANVRAEVARAGHTRNDLAAEIFKSSRMNTWRRMGGDVAFSGPELVRIAAWLGIPVAALITPQVLAIATNNQIEVAA